jgi:hypothetical protein
MISIERDAMNPNTIREHLKESPFVPFRVITNAGTTYDVLHPEFVVPTRTALHLYSVGSDGLADTSPIKIGYANIAALEPHPEQAA